MIGNKIADKTTSVSAELHSKKPNNNNNNNNDNNNNNNYGDVELTTHKKDTYLQKKENKLLKH